MYSSMRLSGTELREQQDSPRKKGYQSSWSPFSAAFPEAYAAPMYPSSGLQMSYSNNNLLHTRQQNSYESIRTWASKSESDNAPLHSKLPLQTYDRDRREITISLDEVVRDGMLKDFAEDKMGCKFLQEQLVHTYGPLKDEIYNFAMTRPNYFQSLSKDVFGNFFAQALVEHADTPDRIAWILNTILMNISEMCLNRYSCRVVQKTFEAFPDSCKKDLLEQFSRLDMLRLSIDQNANHVVQKVVEYFDVPVWKFIVERFLASDSTFFHVIESKYGCRVLQLIVERLAKSYAKSPSTTVQLVVERLMDFIAENCDRLAANEYANYVVQHIISTPKLERYRNKIIQDCLLRNLLSFSQEKFASHVVEKALMNAPPGLLHSMLEELFDGYLPDPQTKKDCLDILLFHQYGNYVVQRMLLICVEMLTKGESGQDIVNIHQIKKWTNRLEHLIDTNEARLQRYSSGKKLLEVLESFKQARNHRLY